MGLLAPLGVSDPALAQGQAAPSVPTREELDPQGRATPRPPEPTRLRVHDEIERAPCPLADPAYADVTMNFTAVEFRNLAGMTAQELETSWAPFAGRELPVATLCEIRDRAATMLRGRGYVAAVQVPPQRIETGGTVVLDVLLAKLVGIRVRGTAGPSESLIAAQLQKLVDQPFFNSGLAERALLLAGDLPGYDIRLNLRPAGQAPGDVIGDVEVVRRPLEILVAGQNYGSRTIGRAGGLLQVRFNDLLGLGDSTHISLFNTAQTSEQTVLQISETLALGTSGLRLGADLVHAWTQPGVAQGAFRSRTFTAGLHLDYPLVRKRELTLRASGGIDWVDQSLDFGATRLSNDHLRVTYLAADLATMDPRSITGALGYSPQAPKWALGGRVELRKGLSGLGASPYCIATPAACLAPNSPTSRPMADPAALVLRSQFIFDYRPAPNWTLSIAPRAQVSNKPLMGYEQFSAGNYTVGRGFDPGAIQGDNGVGFNFELRYGNGIPASSEAIGLQPYLFLDSGWTWSKRPGSGPARDNLQSAGGGVRAQWGSHGRADLTVAVPLDRTALQAERGDVRVLLSVSTQLHPW